MAKDTAIYLVRPQTVAAKLETTTGTAIALTTDDAGFWAYEPRWDFGRVTVTPREMLSSMGYTKPILGGTGAALNWRMPLTDNARFGTLFLAMCGLEASGAVYTPTFEANTTATVAAYHKAKVRTIAGAMGNFELAIYHDRPADINFSALGVLQTPATAALLEPTYESDLPLVGAATLTFGGGTVRVATMRFNLGNTLDLREDVTAREGGTISGRHLGYRCGWITGRQSTITIDPEAGNRDWWDDLINATDVAWECVIGDWTFAATKCNVSQAPEDADRNSKATENVTLSIAEDGLSVTKAA